MFIFVDNVSSAALSDPPDYLDIMCSHFQKYGDRYVYTVTTSLTYGNVAKSSSRQSEVFTSFASMFIALATMYNNLLETNMKPVLKLLKNCIKIC